MSEKRKFHSSQLLSPEEVKSILMKKINEENEKVNDLPDSKIIESEYDNSKYNVLSLFSGCGGLDLGIELSGLYPLFEDKTLDLLGDKEKYNKNRENSFFNIIYSNDIFEEANLTHQNNFRNNIYMDDSDIRKIKSFPKCDVVVGGFPCPGFSEAGPRLVDDERNFLYLHFIRCLIQTQPKVFIAENVKGMLTLGNGEVFKQIFQDFAAAGYQMHYKLLNAADYGVPEIRERVILVGIRNDLRDTFSYPDKTHGENTSRPWVTLRDSIWDLRNNPGEYFQGDFSSIFMSRNRKKSWDEPSFTIQASGRQAPIHPDGKPMIHIGKDRYEFSDGVENNRRLSVKEISRIQTFPDWFEFSKGNSKKNNNAKLDLIYKQIGNAVPVLLAYAIGKSVVGYLRKEAPLISNIS